MSETKSSIPSVALQIALSEQENALNPELPSWLRMVLALMAVYKRAKGAATVESTFDHAHSFDLSLLVWCREADNRETGQTHKKTDGMPFPSPQFQHALKAGQQKLDNGVKNRLPHLTRMGIALYYVFVTLEDADLLGLMFDCENPFDVSMLMWCYKARQGNPDKQLTTSQLQNN